MTGGTRVLSEKRKECLEKQLGVMKKKENNTVKTVRLGSYFYFSFVIINNSPNFSGS